MHAVDAHGAVTFLSAISRTVAPPTKEASEARRTTPLNCP